MSDEVRESVKKMSSEMFGSNVERIYKDLINLMKAKGDDMNVRMHPLAE